ncbi:hypothetical protein Bca52824_011423 [Brassica carinata]|uniref:Uncharacterized protein n=1 Tax=Brassica carinata TaxID=52824 RepID=A0A8X7WH54_BRACI|nr:hypothetical protein Bca52824_011423 [Brassica carinata]
MLGGVHRVERPAREQDVLISIRNVRSAMRGTSTMRGNRRPVREPERAVLNARDGCTAREVTIGTREVRGLVCAGWIHRAGSEHCGRPERTGVYARDRRPARDWSARDRPYGRWTRVGRAAGRHTRAGCHTSGTPYFAEARRAEDLPMHGRTCGA